jgi:hypothetical protein
MNTEKILATASRTFPAPRGYKGTFIVTAQAYQLGGNAHPHFAVTGDIATPAERARGDGQAGGCLHDEAARAWPAIKPIIDLHLSNADDGEPMHATANGFYQLAGSVPGAFGERYHSGNSERHFPITPDPSTPWKNTEYRMPNEREALEGFAEYLRLPIDEAEQIRAACIEAFNAGKASVASSPDAELSPSAIVEAAKAGNVRAKARFARFIDTQRARWAQEARDGIALIKALAR